MRLRVWAPAARAVELDTGGSRHAMRPDAGGWFASDLELAPGTDYAFVIDGGEALADPRSPWQPRGVDGPSRVVDPSAFAWSDVGWTGIDPADLIIYELHIGTFTAAGTFEAAIDRLDHLVDLGVTAVELMPVAEFPGDRGWGYDGVNLYAPHHTYGGPDGLRALVDACHRRGVAVVLDVVYNHLGPTGNHLARFGPYFTDRYRTPWGAAVNLDGPDSHEVRRFFIDNALLWLRDYHVDGLRLDATHALFDASPRHFLAELADDVAALAEQLDRRLFITAEHERSDERLVRTRADGGYGLDAVWLDDFHHVLHVAFTGERAGYYASYGDLDDLRRVMAHAETVGGQRFVVCLQNHDQVGNRARGERINHLTTLELVKTGAAMVLTSPFVPLLFQGEEWAASTPFQYFTDHRDPAVARAVTEGRRREFADFGWDPHDVPDPQDPATFERSKLDWDELHEGSHAHVLAWYRTLLAWRRAHPNLIRLGP